MDCIEHAHPWEARSQKARQFKKNGWMDELYTIWACPSKAIPDNSHIPIEHKDQGSSLRTISNSGYGKQNWVM